MLRSRLWRIVLISSFIFLQAVPRVLNYQGKLTNAESIGRTGVYNIVFTILKNDDPLTDSVGDTLWAETLAVNVEKGLFNVTLGENNPIGLDFDEPYYMELIVNGERLAPREKLAPVSYSFRAIYSDSANAVTDSVLTRSDFTFATNADLDSAVWVDSAGISNYATNSAYSDSVGAIAGNNVQGCVNCADSSEHANRAVYADTADIAMDVSSSSGLGQLNVYKNDGTTKLGAYLGCMLGSADCNYHCGWSYARSDGGVRRISDMDRRNAYGHVTLYYSGSNCTGTIYLGSGRRSGRRSDCYSIWLGTDSLNYVYHTWCCTSCSYQSYRSYGGDCVNSSGSVSAYNGSKVCTEPNCDFLCGDGPCKIKP